MVNLGQVITNGGAAKMFAGTIKHSGSINSDSISLDEQGRVQLFATSDIDINDGRRLQLMVKMEVKSALLPMAI